MPTLFRLLMFIVVIVGLGVGVSVGLTHFVKPEVKERTLRIPARDFLGKQNGQN